MVPAGPAYTPVFAARGRVSHAVTSVSGERVACGRRLRRARVAETWAVTCAGCRRALARAGAS